MYTQVSKNYSPFLIHTSRAVQLFPMSKVNSCLFSYWPTLSERRTGVAKSGKNPSFGHKHLCLSPASHLLLYRGELGLHSVNLSLQARSLLHRPTGEQRRGMKEG